MFFKAVKVLISDECSVKVLSYADATSMCYDVKEPLSYSFPLLSPAVMRRRARLYPFGESVYERFLPNSLRSNNVIKLQSLRVPSGRLWAYDGRGGKKNILKSQLNDILSCVKD